MKKTYTKYIGLHFGCYDCVHKGWYNADISYHIPISKIPGLAYLLWKLRFIKEYQYTLHKNDIFKRVHWLNITKRFPIPDSSFKYAFSSHVIEHLYVEQALQCMKEVHRVLAPGGIVRVAVPDLDRMVSQYDVNRPNDFCNAIFESGSKRDKNRHHWMYNKKSMRDLLVTAGFKKVTIEKFRSGKCAEVELIDNREDSLFMEAER